MTHFTPLPGGTADPQASGTLTWRELRDLRLTEPEQADESAAATLARLRRLARDIPAQRAESGLVRSTLEALAAELVEPQRRLKDALRDADERGFIVHEDGSVGYPPATVGTLDGPADTPGGRAHGSAPPDRGRGPTARDPFTPVNPHAARAQALADRIAAALAAAAAIDTAYARTLDGLRTTTAPATAPDDDPAPARADSWTKAGDHLVATIPVHRTPAELRAWWENLSEPQQREYLDLVPDLIGDVDGIPAAARDEANRRFLPLLVDELAQERGGDTRLDALRLVQARLAEPSDPPVFLLGIGDEGNGRAIVSFGDPDTARNVAAYVPGFGARLDQEFVTDTMKRVQDTAISARRVDPSTAAIVWLGYDAPQHLDVMLPFHAEKGAPAYNGFMAGLAATSAHTAPHLTAIGHSYGALTVVTAARLPGGIPGVADIVLLGGTGSGGGGSLGVAEGHVFVAARDDDEDPADPADPAIGVPLGGPPEEDPESASNLAKIVAGQSRRITDRITGRTTKRRKEQRKK